MEYPLIAIIPSLYFESVRVPSIVQIFYSFSIETYTKKTIQQQHKNCKH